MSRKVIFLYANSPDALTCNKIDLIHRSGAYDTRLIYWDRVGSEVQFPFACNLPASRVIAVKGPEGRRGTKLLNRLRIILKLSPELRRLRPEIVHACGLDVLLAARLACARDRRVRMVFDLQDTDDRMLAPAMRALQRALYARVELFFVTSPRYRSEFLEKFKLMREGPRVVYVPNSPSRRFLGEFEPRDASGSLVVGYIGTLRGERSIATLVEAVGRLREKGLDARVLFAGTGVARRQVEAYAREKSFVTYRGPYAYRSDIGRLYGQVDVVYAVYDDSHNKRIALACRLAEAVVCGLPIVVGDGTYMAEVVCGNGIGWSVPEGDPAVLAARLRGLVLEPQTRAKVAENCHRLRETFLFESYEQSILGAYSALAARAPCRN